MSFHALPNVGILIEQLNPFIFQRLRKEVDVFHVDFNNNKVENESKDLLRLFQKKRQGYASDYKLSDETAAILDKEILKLIHKYETNYNWFDRLFNYTSNIESGEINIALERIWVNFQRMGEFLPLHNHTGVYSFVIWVRVPFSIEDEKDNTANPDLIKNRTANFEFVYNDSLGRINNYPIPVDKTFEGMISIFPSDLQHIVYPFYSTDDVRISVAGNYRVDIKR